FQSYFPQYDSVNHPFSSVTHSSPKKFGPDKAIEMEGRLQARQSKMKNTSLTLLNGILNLFLIIFLPAIIGIWWIAFEVYDCSISEALHGIWKNPVILFFCYRPPHLHVVLTHIVDRPPWQDLSGPANTSWTMSPLQTQWLGMLAHDCIGLWAADLIDMTFLAANWCDFLSISAYYAWALALLAFLKAHLAPSNATDRRFSGNIFTDFFEGIELNPRIGKIWDLKLFHNGHCAMIGWTVMYSSQFLSRIHEFDLSFIDLQYRKFGIVTNSIVIATFIRAIVSVDFLWNEQWYLRSIDICEEPFGFYFTFGSGFFLHFINTLQSQYLVRYPVSLSWGGTISTMSLGGIGYAIYFIASEQKNLVRDTRGSCEVWGNSESSIKVQFVTKNGVTQETFLVCSGLWGIVRHPNYVGAILMTLAMGAACGFKCLLPWTESSFAIPFLALRSLRDEAKCAKKYGRGWELYRKKVKWNLIPGIF
ncbi:7-dehydrocholesterol reductase, partial [Penicillium rolfsii]